MKAVICEAYHFILGDFECIAVSDGTVASPLENTFANVPKGRLEQLLSTHDIQQREIICPFICLVIKAGKNMVLVDTGAGDYAPDTGKLLTNLRSAGVSPADIDIVILTHGHFDHVGGNINREGKSAFPHARYVMHKDEWDYWIKQPRLSMLDETQQKMFTLAQKYLYPIQDRLYFIESGAEIVPGIRAIGAPGHTPGLIVLMISSREEQLWHVSDVLLHPIHLEEVEWRSVFDIDPEKALDAKERILKRVGDGNVVIFSPHFPFPGLGRIVRNGRGWQWQPIVTIR